MLVVASHSLVIGGVLVSVGLAKNFRGLVAFALSGTKNYF
jgi:hypothetical protein